MRSLSLISAIVLLTSAITSTVYFEETFQNHDEFTQNWVQSKAHKNFGKFELSTGKLNKSKGAQLGLMTTEDDKLYAISSKFTSRFNNTDKDFILQYSVKFEQNEECSAAQIKILNDIDQLKFVKNSKFNLLFGPNICDSYRSLDFILTFNDKQHKCFHQIDIPNDFLSHQYTLVIHPNETIQIFLDNLEVANGSIYLYFPTINPKKTDELESLGNQKQRRSLPVSFKKPNKVNLDNVKVGQYSNNFVGFDLWQIKSGTLFYDILITDDLNYAKAFSKMHFLPRQTNEKEYQV